MTRLYCIFTSSQDFDPLRFGALNYTRCGLPERFGPPLLIVLLGPGASTLCPGTAPSVFHDAASFAGVGT